MSNGTIASVPPAPPLRGMDPEQTEALRSITVALYSHNHADKGGNHRWNVEVTYYRSAPQLHKSIRLTPDEARRLGHMLLATVGHAAPAGGE